MTVDERRTVTRAVSPHDREAERAEVTSLLTRLVGCDSTNPTGEETSTAQILSDYLAAVGYQVELDHLAPGRVNLVARRRFGDGGPTLMLNSHLDVVPAGPGWTSEPFSPAVRDGKLYGRGSADAKGSLAAMAVACARLTRTADAGPVEMAGEIVYTAVSDEEGGSTGARHLIDLLRRDDDLPDAVIVGEPTELRLLTAHKGSVRPVLEVTGVAAHAATPHQGVNAVTVAAALLQRLDAYAEDLKRTVHPLLGSPTCTPVLIAGGEAPNAVPERCRITLDRRLLPGEGADDVLAAINEILEEFNRAHTPARARIAECAPSTGGPSQTPDDHPFVRLCQTALESVGMDPALGGLTVNCDMTHFRAAGVPALVLGPGRLEVMHAVDEHVELSQVTGAVEAYAAVLTAALSGGEQWWR